jgi:hypothetical protein
MALQDQNLVLSSGQAVTTTALSTFTYDILFSSLLNSTSGTYLSSSTVIDGNTAAFGEDLGLGRGKGTPAIEVFTGAGTPAAATSLQVAFQGAVDNLGGTIAGLTFIPYIQTRGIPLASILSSIRLCAFDLPRREVGQGLPRFINLNYIVVGAPFTGLTVTSYINTGGTSAQATLGQYSSNY